MKISLVFASCNQSHYLAESIDSAQWSLQQGRHDHEIIVVDDCSTDGSADDLPEDVNVIRTPKQRGCSMSRRLGAMHATGDVIILSDPHVYFLWDVLPHIAEVALEHNGIVQPAAVLEGQGLTFGGALKLNREGLVMGRVGKLRYYSTLFGSVYAFRRSVHEVMLWPMMPGLWGKYEQMLSTLVYRLGMSVRTETKRFVVHRRYRTPGEWPFPMSPLEPITNSYWFHAGCFPSLFKRYFRPLLVKALGEHESVEQCLQSASFAEFRDWLSWKATMKELEFLEQVCKVQNLTERISELLK